MKRPPSLLRATAALVLSFSIYGCVQQAPTSSQSAPTAQFDPEWIDGVLQPLPDGFPSEPLVIVNLDDAGSRDGTYARAIAAALAPFVPVDVSVSNAHSAKGTFPGIVDSLEQPGGSEGRRLVVLSIPGAVSDFHVEPLETQLGRGLDDFVMVRTTETQPFVFAQRSDAPWGDSFSEFITWAETHEGQVRYATSTVGSGLDIAMEWLLRELGLSVVKIPTGSAAAAVATVAAGEADITMSNVDLSKPAIELGLLEVIWVSTSSVPDEWSRPGVASIADGLEYGFADQPRWGSVMSLGVAGEVPESHIAWLDAALGAAAGSEAYADHLDGIYGAELYSLTSVESDALARSTYDAIEPLIQQLGLGWR